MAFIQNMTIKIRRPIWIRWRPWYFLRKTNKITKILFINNKLSTICDSQCFIYQAKENNYDQYKSRITLKELSCAIMVWFLTESISQCFMGMVYLYRLKRMLIFFTTLFSIHINVKMIKKFTDSVLKWFVCREFAFGFIVMCCKKTLAKYTLINHDCLHIVRTLFISYYPLLYPFSNEKFLVAFLFW